MLINYCVINIQTINRQYGEVVLWIHNVLKNIENNLTTLFTMMYNRRPNFNFL